MLNTRETPLVSTTGKAGLRLLISSRSPALPVVLTSGVSRVFSMV
ncbi:hypothetical protein [Pseudomonas sp. N8]